MAFPKGTSGNPGGRKRTLGLSRAVRRSQGLKSWAWLCKAGDGQVLERKEIGEDKDGNPIVADVVPSVKVLMDVHKLILAYTWGTPVAQGADDLERRIEEIEKQLVGKPEGQWPAH
jgi:hypothetical protein